MEAKLLKWVESITKLANENVSGNLYQALRYRFYQVRVVDFDREMRRLNPNDLTDLYTRLSRIDGSTRCGKRHPEEFLSLAEMRAIVKAEEPYKNKTLPSVSIIQFEPNYRDFIAYIEGQHVPEDNHAGPANRAYQKQNIYERIPTYRVAFDLPNIEYHIPRVETRADRAYDALLQADIVRVAVPNDFRRADGTKRTTPLRECEICVKKVETVLSCPQKHHFCHSCIKKTYSAMAMGEMKIVSGCLHDGCSESYNANELQIIVGHKVIGNIRFRKLQRSNKNLFSCPYCPYTGPVLEGSITSEYTMGLLQCYSKDCARLSCVQCQEDHEGMTCAEATKKRQKNLIISNAVDDNLLRTCPNPTCRKRVLRQEGCSIITCVCEIRFCWNCENDISGKPYDHFCNCHKPKCTKCHLYQTNLQQDIDIANARATKVVEPEK